ncbi:MAG: hypothetical protein M1823_000811 [Watsoniomyces obsoletus]|nr:MAG: hypothetical protein M1823_000811 [Watsoniomyces obsoletus]
MDDIAGLSWPSGPSEANGNGKLDGRPNVPYPSLTPSPTPSSSNQTINRLNPGIRSGQGGLTQSKPTSRTSTPSNDSFSNLVSFGSNKDGANLSLLERQKRMVEERSRKEAEQKSRNTQFNPSDKAFWDSLDGSKKPAGPVSKSQLANQDLGLTGMKMGTGTESRTAEDDLLHAFSANAPVNTSSHFPPVGSSISTPTEVELGDDPDDPFGLGRLEKRHGPEKQPELNDTDDDDVLGVLGKPVDEFRSEKSKKPNTEISESRSKKGASEQDNAVAELVDMGFSAGKAREALSSTQSGTDVQAAVGWLLDAAHREAKHSKQVSSAPGRRENGDGMMPPAGDSPALDVRPAWMREKGSTSTSGRQSKESSSNTGDKDITQAATEIGATLFKSANTFWKTGKKKVQKAVTELQQDGNSTQPKWMVDAQRHQAQDEGVIVPEGRRQSTPQENRAPKNSIPAVNVTEEALMLEGDQPRPRRREKTRAKEVLDPTLQHQQEMKREQVRPVSREVESSRQRFQQTTVTVSRSQQDSQFKPSLTKTVIEEQSAQAYVSPARRKKPSSRPAEAQHQERPPVSAPLGTSSNGPSKPASPAIRQPVSLPARPKPPTRTIPAVSPAVLSSSATNRHKGSESFKRGDYSGAHTFYSNALSGLPSEHPITIVILCNRSLVNLKNGDPKAAVADAEAALRVIGPSQGDGESITLHDNDGEHTKNMREFYSKAMIRRAEGLEQMEKWSEAATAWREAVESGAGGSTSIQARDRCERAAGKTTKVSSAAAPIPTKPKPTNPRSATATAKTRQPLPPPSQAVSRTSIARSNEAVQKLRQANQLADRTDEEKFALSDHVDARIKTWKEGKQDNIRALL